MQRMAIEYFLPIVEEKFGSRHVIAVKDAHGGQHITEWYDQYDLEDDGDVVGPSYDQLIGKVSAAIKGKDIESVSFIWMQGESDALNVNPSYRKNYRNNLHGLIELIESDLKTNINFVIGRLNTFRINLPGWITIRTIQVEEAEGAANGTWVNTDDLGTVDAGLHFSPEGYELLGERFAIAAISLINSN